MNPNALSSNHESDNDETSGFESLSDMPSFDEHIQKISEQNETFEDTDKALTREAEALSHTVELQKKQTLAWIEAIKINPGDIRIEDESRGLFSYSLESGEKVFGSIYSIMDMNENLGKMKGRSETIRSGSGDGSLMGINVTEGAGYESVVVASGSFAQREINPYPADMDFAEHLKIIAENQEEAGSILSNLVQETVEKSMVGDESVFTEMKVGIYPDGFGEKSGKSIKWTPDEIKAGEKQLETPDGKVVSISLTEACQNPGSMIKMDWLTVEGGQVKEMTKVINLTEIDKNGNILLSNSQNTSAFQEIYFGDPTNFGITEKTLESGTTQDYLDFLQHDAAKYFGKGNYLKTAKRSYNLLKCSGQIESARALAPLFSSTSSELIARSESLSLLPEYIEQQQKIGKETNIDDFKDSLEKIIDVVDAMHDNGIFSDEEQDYVHQTLDEIPSLMKQPDLTLAKNKIQELSSLITEKANKEAKKFLDQMQDVPELSFLFKQ